MTETSSGKILVIGYGNTLRKDDGLGPYLVRQIAGENWPNVEAIAVLQLTPELCEQIAQASQVVFMDARMNFPETSPLSDFQIPENSFHIEKLTSGNRVTWDTHLSCPTGLLFLTEKLFGVSPLSWWITVYGYDFSLGENLSPAALRNGYLALAQLKRWFRVPNFSGIETPAD